MRSRHIAGLLVAAVALLPLSRLAAQSKPIELGTDIGMSLDFGGGTLTTVSIPTSSLRVGFWMNDRVSVEPNLGFTWLHFSGENITTLDAAVALLYHFNTDPSRARPYVTVFPGLTHLSAGASSTQFFGGAGLGVLLPLQERLAARLEGQYSHTFSSDEVGSGNTVAARIGFSYFSH